MSFIEFLSQLESTILLVVLPIFYVSSSIILMYFLVFIIATAPPFFISFIIISLHFFKLKMFCHSFLEISDLFLKSSSKNFCFCKTLIKEDYQCIILLYWIGIYLCIYIPYITYLCNNINIYIHIYAYIFYMYIIYNICNII